MERYSDKAIEIINELHTERIDYESEYIPFIDCANQCAAYEDTGLAPEDITRAFDEAAVMKLAAHGLGTTPERLSELAQADREGRCVVMPCKVGDKIYRVFAEEIFEHRVGSMKYFAIQGRWDIETYPSCPYVESSIGKTIFLTREEAEAALEAQKGAEHERD